MTGLVLTTAVAAWWICWYMSAARAFAHFQRRWPTLARRHRTSDRLFAAIWGLAGPFSLVWTYILAAEGCDWRWWVPERFKERASL